jgi:hypothetical protein
MANFCTKKSRPSISLAGMSDSAVKGEIPGGGRVCEVQKEVCAISSKKRTHVGDKRGIIGFGCVNGVWA